MSLIRRKARPLRRDDTSLRDDRLFIVASDDTYAPKQYLRAEHYPVATVPSACERAERLDSGVGGGDNPDANTSRVYLLWKSIVAKALPSQLPEPLRGLLP